VLFVLFASAAFATSGPLGRAARPTHPMLVALGRCALAAVVLFALDPRGLLASARSLSPRVRAAVLGVGVLLAAHFTLFLWGLDRTSLPAAVSLISLEPLAVLLCAWGFHGLRPTGLELAGVAVATGGAVLVARGAGTGEHSLGGDLLVIGAVVLYGFYVAAARGLKDALPARHYATLVYGAAAAALVPAALFLPEGAIATPGLASMGAIVALALVPTVVGHTAVQSAARRLPPSIVALVSPGETVGAVAIGAVMMGAIPTGAEIAGAVVIVLGATLAVLGARRPAGSA
jgi:drug/metabolite transporter (DMT)-like permease